MKEKKIFYRFILALFLVFLILPLLVVVIWSFSKNWPWPKLLPGDLGLRGWKHFFNPRSKSLKILVKSIGLSLVVTLTTLIISLPAAKALAIYEFRGKKLIEILVFAPIIVPTVAVAMGIHLSFIRLGLAGKPLGVILIQIIPGIPYGVKILQNVFQIIGDDLEIQARVLGAGPLKSFFYITLPLLGPGILSAAAMIFIVSFSQYFLTYLIGGGRVVTFPMLMFPFIQGGDRMVGSVYSLVFIATGMVCLLLMERAIKRFYKEGQFFY